MVSELLSRIVTNLTKYISGPDCGEEADKLDEGVGDGVTEPASGEEIDDDYFLAGCGDLKIKFQFICCVVVVVFASLTLGNMEPMRPRSLWRKSSSLTRHGYPRGESR